MKNLSFCGRLRRLRYPATPEGRKKYIQNSLSKNVTPWIIEGLICLILLPLLIPLMVYASGKWICQKIWRAKS